MNCVCTFEIGTAELLEFHQQTLHLRHLGRAANSSQGNVDDFNGLVI